jgi:hypothetical protein
VIHFRLLTVQSSALQFKLGRTAILEFEPLLLNFVFGLLSLRHLLFLHFFVEVASHRKFTRSLLLPLFLGLT